MKGYKTRTHA